MQHEGLPVCTHHAQRAKYTQAWEFLRPGPVQEKVAAEIGVDVGDPLRHRRESHTLQHEPQE